MAKVGGLPLALAQAGCYMRQTGTSIRQYLRLYEESWKRVMQKENLTEYGDRSVHTSWSIAFDYIKRKDSGDAAKSLQLWSFLDNRDIWFELFNNKCNTKTQDWVSEIPDWFRRVYSDPLKFNDVIETLLAYSLIEARQDSDAYSVHLVLHEWCGKMIDTKERLGFLFIAVRSIAFAVPIEQEGDCWKIQRRMLPHIDRFTPDVVESLCLGQTESTGAHDLHGALYYLGQFYNYQHQQEKSNFFF